MKANSFRQTSLYSGAVSWRVDPRESPRSQKNCFVLPGQGSMFPGMGRGFEDDSTFQHFFSIADLVCKKAHFPRPSRYVFTPNSLTLEELEAVESLALFTFSVAMSHKLAEEGVRPQALTGHSFGEFAGLVVSGILDFETGLSCVLSREKCLGERNKAGFMVAVNTSELKIRELLPQKKTHISNVNSLTQTVISTTWEHLQEIESTLKESEIKYKRLASPQPFHSPLLEDFASELLLPSLDTHLVTAPRIPFFSGVEKKWVATEEDVHLLLPKILENQLTRPIDFRHQLDRLSSYCTHFIEVGPRPFLVPLIKENLVNKQVTVSWGGDLLQPVPENDQRISKVNRSQVTEPTLSRVNSVIARITGYSVEKIQFEDKFQEDLGIDSIKTLEISLEIQKEFQLPQASLGQASQIKTVGELAFQVETQKKKKNFGLDKKNESPQPFQLYQRVWREKDITQERSWVQDEKTVWIRLNNNLTRTSEIASLSSPICTLILDCSEISNSLVTPAFIKKSVPQFFDQIQELIKNKVINHDTDVRVLGLSAQNGFSSMVTTFFRSLKKENEIAFVSEILFDERVDLTREIVGRELGLRKYQNVKITNGKRYTLELEPVQTTQEKEVLQTGNLVVIGGSRGIAKSAVTQLFNNKNWKVHVLGRTPPTEVQEALYYQVDAADEEAMAEVFRRIRDEHGTIDILVHAAGSEMSRQFRDKTQEEIRSEWFSKALSSKIASDLADKYSISAAILFSSVISEFGNRGQAVYGAANAFARKIWEESSSEKVSRTVIDWPPWQNTGMTANPVINDILKKAGVSLLPPEEGARWFRESLAVGGGMLCSEKDLLLYKGPLAHLGALGSLQPVVYPHQGELVFEFRVSLKDFPELVDHSVQGRVLLPLALMATWFREIGQGLTGREDDLSELQIFRPLEITNDQMQLSILVKRSGSQNHALAFSLISSDKRIASGTVQLRGPIEADRTVKSSKPENQFQAEDIYVSDGLFHGPKFQFLDRVEIQENKKVLGKPDPKRIEELNQAKFPRAFAMIETALQTTAVAGWKLDNWIGLPVAIERILIREELINDNNWFWEITEREIAQELMTASLDLFDGDGRFLGRIEKLVFQKKA